MKSRKPLMIVVYILLVLALLPSTVLAADPLALPPATSTMHVTVDSAPLTVTYYKNVVYVANPVCVRTGTAPNYTCRYDYQSMHIYVPSNATADSPILLWDNNSGWNGAPPSNSVVDGTAYVTTGSNPNKTAVELKAGYVIANVGCRLRSSVDLTGNYIGHAPAQVVDVKAAIRYLHYNQAALGAGNTNRIIITGTSGGGALGVAVAAAGNSPDYYSFLYAIGAAGVTYDAQSGTYSSTIEDDLFGTVLYCAIADLNHMDAAYDWLYGNTRLDINTYTPNTYSQAQLDASAFLQNDYVTYINGLGLKDENGNPLTATLLTPFSNPNPFRDAVKAKVEKGVAKGCREIAAGYAPDANWTTGPCKGNSNTDWYCSWYTVDANCNATVDLDKYLYFVSKNTALKAIPASDNVCSPLPHTAQSESTEAGTIYQSYSSEAEWTWNNNACPGDGVGLDDTGLTWKQFILTDAGKAVVKQMDMISPMPYLAHGGSDPAPYWYFRHGLIDRDTSADVSTAIYYAALNNSKVSNVNFNLAWLKPHSGDYDVPEAYEWVAEAVDNAKYFDAVDALIGNKISHGFSLPTGDATNVITYSSSNASVFNVVNGQAVVTRPAANQGDASVTLTVRVLSDKLSSAGFNYGKVDVTRAFTFTVPARLPGDANGDGTVNVLDLVQVRNNFGKTGTPCWIGADLNCDGVVDGLDLTLVRNNFTRTE